VKDGKATAAAIEASRGGFVGPPRYAHPPKA